jgi:2-polyprenyl-3-methyl-5-hydroxy-6-metoxy-1,4-benzoquinol methylase
VASSSLGARQALAGSAEARVYADAGNPAFVDLVGRDARVVLDVGCGSGDNAALLRRRDPRVEVHGITASESEAVAARPRLDRCWVADVERALPAEIAERQYDAVLFCHVLEHLRDPADVVRRAVTLLRPGGACVIAVPNVLVWFQRVKFALGRFEYEPAGIMDETHVRFFTYETAARHLLAKAPSLRVVERRATGGVPLGALRRRVLPARVAARIDAAGCRRFPNLFGWQVLIKAIHAG